MFALGAEAFAHFPPKARCVDQDLDIGSDAGVVEYIGRQGDDGLDQIGFQHMARISLSPELAPSVKMGRAIQNDTEARAALRSGRILDSSEPS